MPKNRPKTGVVLNTSPEKVKSPTKNVGYFKNLYFGKFTDNDTATELKNRFEIIQSTIGTQIPVDISNPCVNNLPQCKPRSSPSKNTIPCMLKHEEGKKDDIPQYEFSMVSDLAQKTKENTFTSTVTEKTVCRIGNQVVKKTKFNSETLSYNVELTLFLLILEITIQNYVHDLSMKDSSMTDLIVPKITKYYFDAGNAEVTMIMEYIDTEPLSYANYPKCIEILKHLKYEHNIFHNDTHSDNIRQTKDGKKIVMLDWGKGNLINNDPSITGLYEGMTESVGFAHWLNAKELLKPRLTKAHHDKYTRENPNPIFGGRKSKRKWSMKYKKSINCRNPKGFSQKQYCKYGRKTHGRKTHTQKIKKSRFL